MFPAGEKKTQYHYVFALYSQMKPPRCDILGSPVMRLVGVPSVVASNGVIGCVHTTETAASQADATYSRMAGGNA